MKKVTATNNEVYDYLINLLSQTNDNKTLSQLLDVLMTDKEKQEMMNRLKIFCLLQQGSTQREISTKLGVGIATVSRGAKVAQQHSIDELFPQIITAFKDD